MRLVFYPPQDNLDLWSRRSSEPQFCRSFCSWRHSRPREPQESSSQRWIPRRRDTPARCSRVQSCLSRTDRGCGQTSPTRNIFRNKSIPVSQVGHSPGYWEHDLTEQSLDIVLGVSGLWGGWGRVSSCSWYPSSWASLWTPVSYVFSLARLSSYNWSDSASVSLSRTNTSEMKNGGNKNWFPWLQDLERWCYHHWEMGDGIIIFLLL